MKNHNALPDPFRAMQAPAWLSSRSLRYGLVGAAAGLLFPIFGSLIELWVLHLPTSIMNVMQVQASEPLLWIIDTAPIFLGILAAIAGWRQDLVRQANQRLKEHDADLNDTRAKLEQDIAERALELDRRNSQMRAVVTFAHQVAELQDIDSLLPASVAMIAERFEQRGANLFLLNETGQWAVLRAASSADASNQVRDGFRIAVGDSSLVGRVAKRGKLQFSSARIDSRDPLSRAAAPSTPASEVALPLVVRGKLLGVLDIYSLDSQAIGQNEADAFQLLADQLAGSIENARLTSESQAAATQLGNAKSQDTRISWQRYLKDRGVSYQFTPAGVKSVTPGTETSPTGGLQIPLNLRGEDIGLLTLRRKVGSHWNQTEKDLLQRLADQIALALENARLLEETRQRAAQERMVGEVSARFSHSLDVDALLQSAVREFAALPEVTEAGVYLRPVDDDGRQNRI